MRQRWVGDGAAIDLGALRIETIVIESLAMRRTLSIAVVLVGLQVTAAHAHIQLMFPLQRYSDQKSAPCGRAGNDGRGETVNVFAPGETITVSFDEHVNHPGHFRIAFDDDGQDAFYDPPTQTTCDTGLPILADCIPDLPGGGIGSYDITLPNIECENCTLQVIQVMTDKPPFGDGNDMYYQCADLALRAGNGNGDGGPGNPDAGVEPDAGGDPDPGDDGCQAAGPPSLSTLLLMLGMLVLLRRRNNRA